MSKQSDKLKASLQEALAHAEGQTGTTTSHVVMVPYDVDVESIRKGLGLSRPAFCQRFGLDVRAVQDWEQKRRRPDRTARAYLMVIAHNPAAVEAALHTA